MTATEPTREDEFYIGYEDRMMRGIRQRVRRFVVVSACCAIAAAALAVAVAATLPSSRFEFGVTTEMTGVLSRNPYPILNTGSERVWLVGWGKSGADVALAGMPDGRITVRGSRVLRGRHRMLEVEGAARASSPASSTNVAPRTTSLGVVTLRGEIVDSKCFLGVMNPGEGAVHRDCARRCLSGGMPPMLLVRDGAHREELVVLVSAEGGSLSRGAAQVAGAPVDVTGRLVRQGDDYVLFVSGWKMAS